MSLHQACDRDDNSLSFRNGDATPSESSATTPRALTATTSQSKNQQEQCVICLDAITERAIAVPCNHCSFDFLCLASWVQANATCPLCKAGLIAIEYDWRSPDDFKTYRIPEPHAASSRGTSTSSSGHPLYRDRPRNWPQRPYNRGLNTRGYRRPTFPNRNNSYGYRNPNLRSSYHTHGINETITRDNQQDSSSHPNEDPALVFRREVYQNKLYSLHTGSNRISRFRDFTPVSFSLSSVLQSKARMWIRRELQVFELSPSTVVTAPTTLEEKRRQENREFLLTYIISILKTADLRSSDGEAQEKLAPFLGGEENARLFTHELESWLRSPFVKLEDWDRWVQYRVPASSSSTDCRDGARRE